MQIKLYNNSSPTNKIQKDITSVLNVSGTLRNESNVVNPTIRIYAANLPYFNYAHIPEFNRYYYLRNVRAVRNDIFEITLQSDPLMSFDISKVAGVVIESEILGNNYLNGRQFIRSVKSKTDIINFPSGLLDTGEYILITAGG